MLAFQRTIRPTQISAVSNGIRKFITLEQQQQLMNNYAKIMLYGNNYNAPTAMAEFAQNCCERLELPAQIHDIVVSISENIYQLYGEDLQATVDQQLKKTETDEFLDLYQEQQAVNPRSHQEVLLDALGGLFVQIQTKEPANSAASTCTIEEITDEPQFKWKAVVNSLTKKIMELMQGLKSIFMTTPSTSGAEGATQTVTLNWNFLCIGIVVVFVLGAALAPFAVPL